VPAKKLPASSTNTLQAMWNRLFFIFLWMALFALPQASSAQGNVPETIDVRLYASQDVSAVKVFPMEGAYFILDEAGTPLLRLSVGQEARFTALGHHVEVVVGDTLFYVQGELMLQGRRFQNYFTIRPLGYAGRSRTFDDHLLIRATEGSLQLLNRVAFESYIAGVVQAESGYLRHPEYYQVQAMIARTYAMRVFQRHAAEGFNVCDQVHCQAYYGRSEYPAIVHAVMLTRGEVVVDQNNRLIEAVYHANCGGETVNSEDLWPQAVPYLRSVRDPHCGDMPGAVWQASIPQTAFFNYLESAFGLQATPAQRQQILRFSQNSRLHHLDSGSIIHLRHIRSHFNLRSTFFSFTEQGSHIIFSGRGYGHGVGLCQEGAMRMAEKGYPRDAILRFYYQGVRIIDWDVMFPSMNNW
jgi:stage II sporulation protein D